MNTLFDNTTITGAVYNGVVLDEIYFNNVLVFRNSVIVTFNGNGGSVSYTSKEVKYGSAIGDMPSASMSGYSFNGWWTAASGGTLVTPNTVINENITLYAQFVAQTVLGYASGVGNNNDANLPLANVFDGDNNTLGSYSNKIGYFGDSDAVAGEYNEKHYNYIVNDPDYGPIKLPYGFKFIFYNTRNISGVRIKMPTTERIMSIDNFAYDWWNEKDTHDTVAHVLVDGVQYGPSVNIRNDGGTYAIDFGQNVSGKEVAIIFNRNNYYVNSGGYFNPPYDKYMYTAHYYVIVEDIEIISTPI